MEGNNMTAHMGSKTLAGKQPHGLSKHGNKQKQRWKVNSHWAQVCSTSFCHLLGSCSWFASGDQVPWLSSRKHIYIYMFFGGKRFGTKQFLECIVYTLDESHMGIEFGMKQPLGSIWRKSMQSQESGMESGSSLARGAASLACGGLLLLWPQSPCAW